MTEELMIVCHCEVSEGQATRCSSDSWAALQKKHLVSLKYLGSLECKRSKVGVRSFMSFVWKDQVLCCFQLLQRKFWFEAILENLTIGLCVLSRYNWKFLMGLLINHSA